MRTLLVSMLLSLTTITLLGCSSSPDSSPASKAPAKAAPAETAVAPAAPSGEGHAEADVVPGSYEDWCDEHGVAESQCTRCNGDLIPAFKATGDWCDSHGLPKSQCTTCDPSLKIVRPPKPGA